jgi:pyruvate dehydrogenase E2 component (dihydrolipoamide acetyltransferase)
MSVSVSMPQLGESVTEGTVTRWLKREGEHVEADEPLLEVSTDKVDTEIPSPVSGVLRGITVAEDETVAVGAELAVIDEDGAGGQAAMAEVSAPPAEAPAPPPVEAPAPAAAAPPEPEPAAPPEPEPAPAAAEAAPPPQAQPSQAQPSQAQPSYAAPSYAPPVPEPAPAAPEPPAAAPAAGYAAGNEPPATYAVPADTGPAYAEPTYTGPAYTEPTYTEPAYTGPAPAGPAPAPGYDTGNGAAAADGGGFAEGPDGPYVTPLVRKLAAEHGIDLASVTGTGVGGRIRKQDVLDAARVSRGPDAQQLTPQAEAATAPPVAAGPPAAPVTTAPVTTAPVAAPVSPAPVFPAPAYQAPAPGPTPAPVTPRSPIVPSSLRGTTERMSRARQVIAQRMVESLQTSAQLTTVVEADVTAIARLRDRAKALFEAREGVKLSFLPFFALATVEALKVHPKLNAVIDTASGQVTYHDAEHLGIAVDTERGLMVPVIRNAGDLNIGGLARKIADLAERTRAGQVNPDELAGGTFTLTNTGSRGALFDTPIINQPQVGILGTGTVVKRAVVVEDPTLGEVITVRSMVYLALTYDHRLVDGADAARFLVTMKSRLEEGAFETELGL